MIFMCFPRRAISTSVQLATAVQNEAVSVIFPVGENQDNRQEVVVPAKDAGRKSDSAQARKRAGV